MPTTRWLEDAAVPVRADIAEAHEEYWRRLARPGTWWTGAERVALAAESRAARGCGLCRERKAALSPSRVRGEHETAPGSSELLSPAAIDAVHRIVSDPSRLSSGWVEGLDAAGLDDAHYVELVGIVVSMVSIDEMARGVGASLAPLPDPVEGAPSRKRPPEAKGGRAWVPLLPDSQPKGENADLWPMRGPFVIRALSLVPDAVRDLQLLSAAHYLPVHRVADLSAGGRMSRPQMELVASRVSALNECFY
jgi:hypothetical protein